MTSWLLFSWGYHRAWRIYFEFAPEDYLIGIFWRKAPDASYKEPGIHIWIWVLPTLSIHIGTFRPIEGWIKELHKPKS